MYSLPQSYNQTSKCKRCISSNAYLLDTYRYKGYVVTKVSRSNYNTVYDMRKVMLSVTYRFNASRSKYKGTGAANDELRRL